MASPRFLAHVTALRQALPKSIRLDITGRLAESSPKDFSHGARWSEPGLFFRLEFESAGQIKCFGVRIRDYVQHFRAVSERSFRGISNEFCADTLSPMIRIDEQAVQLRSAFAARNNSAKTNDPSVAFGDKNLPRKNLFHGQCNRIRVGNERFAIFFPDKRGAPLQILELSLFARNGGSYFQSPTEFRCS